MKEASPNRSGWGKRTKKLKSEVNLQMDLPFYTIQVLNAYAFLLLVRLGVCWCFFSLLLHRCRILVLKSHCSMLVQQPNVFVFLNHLKRSNAKRNAFIPIGFYSRARASVSSPFQFNVLVKSVFSKYWRVYEKF